MLVIGHRGLGLERENTVSSLKKAQELGVDMVEVDLRQTKDGQIILMHDLTLLRTHDDSRKVSKLAWDEIQEIGKKENNPIPTLEEVLENISIDINLELKEGGMEEKVLTAIKKFSHKVLISSNKPTVLMKIRTLDESIPTGFVIGPKMGHIFPAMMGIAHYLKPYSIHPYHTLITPRHMKSMRETGAKIYPWTVNSIHEYEILKGFGIDGIFTDQPDLIKK